MVVIQRLLLLLSLQQLLSRVNAFLAPATKRDLSLRSSPPHNLEEAIIIRDEEKILRQILVGKHKWLGGALDASSGTIYGIPSHSKYIICLSPPPSDGNSDDESDEPPYQINMLRLPSYITKNAQQNGGKHRDHQFKWLRGIIANNNTYLYGIPSWSNDGVLKVNIREWTKWREDNPSRRIIHDHDSDDGKLLNRLVTTIPFPEETIYDNDDAVQKQQHRWMWHGAALNANSTAIYCIPSNAQHVLKVDLETSTTSYLPIPPPQQSTNTDPTNSAKQLLHASNKWYGGILGNNNCIYGIPYAAGSVLCIDANTDKVSLLGNFGWNEYNFHGGVKSKFGSIYAFPAHANHVLKINTNYYNNENMKLMLSLLPIQRAPYDNDTVTRYKWLGGCTGKDGNIYAMPSDSSSVLHINVMNDVVTTFGCIENSDPTTYGSSGGSRSSSRSSSNTTKYIEKNKFQGGVLGRDGFIYALPSNAKGILRIDSRPVTDEERSNQASSTTSSTTVFLSKDRVSCIGLLEHKTDKWQGGFAIPSGAIYAIPENCNSVLKVLPPRSEDVDQCIKKGLHGVEISSL